MTYNYVNDRMDHLMIEVTDVHAVASRQLLRQTIFRGESTMKKYLYATILILSASLAHSKTNEEVPLTKREAIAIGFPLAAETLRRLEIRRRVSFKNDELSSALQSAEFTREYAVVRQEFCGKKENAANLACTTQK
ncbi:hypothetical protein [Janthinobacterium tructae]